MEAVPPSHGRWKLACVAALPFAGSLGLWLLLERGAARLAAPFLIIATLVAWMWVTEFTCSACGSLRALRPTGTRREIAGTDRSLISLQGFDEVEYECRYCAGREWHRNPKPGRWVGSGGG